MPPVVHAVPENGTPHLLGTRGTHGALVFIESQSLLLERQSAVIKQPANLAFGVIDRGFIEYAMHPARQNRIDVRHQFDAITVVAAKIGKGVGKVLAAGEMLLERREAAAERVPSSVDDLRIRQNQMNQPDVQPIVGHFIDEKRYDRLAINPGGRQIPFAKSAQLRMIERSDRLEKRRLV